MYNQKIIKKIKRCAKEGSYDELLNYIEGCLLYTSPSPRDTR